VTLLLIGSSHASLDALRAASLHNFRLSAAAILPHACQEEALRPTAFLPVIAFLLCTAFSAESEKGSVCVAPLPVEPPSTAATPELFCHSGNLSLKIDKQQVVSWPRQESLKIESLDLTQRHRVTILCDGKPQQSFGFRFSDFKSKQLCLFINDLYQTAQLWESKQENSRHGAGACQRR
jgi:hypothetical protein